MASVDYKRAVAILNQSCFDDWRVAFERLTPELQEFVNTAMSGVLDIGRGNGEWEICEVTNGPENSLIIDNKSFKYFADSDVWVSDCGNVIKIWELNNRRSKYVEIKVLKIHKAKTGRLYFWHQQKRRYVDDAVYELFIGEPRPRCIVHIDGDESNCKADNLAKGIKRRNGKVEIACEWLMY